MLTSLHYIPNKCKAIKRQESKINFLECIEGSKSKSRAAREEVIHSGPG